MGLAIQAMTTRILGIGLVCMIHPSALRRNYTSPVTASGLPYTITDSNLRNKSNSRMARYVNWNYKVQSNIVAAHDWGELILLPVAGILINSKNVSNTLALSIFLGILCTIIFPLASNTFDAFGAFTSRFTLGLTHAFSSPAIDASVAEYIPYNMRNTLYSVVLSGNQIASIFVNTVVAYTCHSETLDGWPSGFYFVSFLGVLWLLLWMSCSNRSSRKLSIPIPNRKHSSQNIGIRYLELISSPALWALLPCNVAAIWTTRLLMYYIPSFYRDVLHLSLMENGVFSSLPFLALCFGKIIFSAFATWLNSFHATAKNNISKLFNTVAFVGSGAMILCCTVTRYTSSTSVLLYITTSGLLFSATSPGFRCSVVSLNKRYAALVSSTCTMASMIGAIVFPYIVGLFVKHGNRQEWHHVFLTVAALDVTAAVIYCAFGSVEEREEHKLFSDKVEKPLLEKVDSESDD